MNILVKGLIIYILMAVSIRLMGKRQIGELQPGELIITMVLSEIATMPLQDKNFPMLSGITLIFLFVSLELLSSFLAMKFRPYRTAMQGHSVLIIKDGHLLQKNLAMIRYSTDDLMEALRLKDVFDICQRLVGLTCDVFSINVACCWVNWKLTGNIQCVASKNCLGVWADSCRCFVCVDNFVHWCNPRFLKFVA